MTWNYRIIRTPTGMAEQPFGFAIHEVYYDDDGAITGWTQSPVLVCGGDDVADLLAIVKMVEGAFAKDVIESTGES